MEKGGYKIGSYRISDIYQGGYSGLAPPDTSGYITAGSLGMTTDPRSANILKEVSDKLSSGAKQIEIEAVSPEIFDAIPRQHFKEVNRLAKLTGVNVSLHGPVMDVSGISQNGFSEATREAAERKVEETLKRSYDLNPDGNITVNFHSAEGIPGSQLLPPKDRTEKSRAKRLIVVNKESGRPIALETEEQYSPRTKELKPVFYTPEKRIENLNETEWENSLNQVIFQKEQIDKIIEDSLPLLQQYMEKLEKGKLDPRTIGINEQLAYKHYMNAGASLHDIERNLHGLFDKAYKYSDDKIKEHLKEVVQVFQEKLGNVSEEKENLNLLKQSDAMQALINGLRPATPKVYTEIENYATEKTAQTFGNAAWKSYQKFRDKSPVLVIENPPAGFALSTGEDIKNIVEASRKQFVDNAMKPSDKGGLNMSEKEAGRAAEKFIGATWDVGHINMLRKFGYKEEDIVKETEAVAPYVKHVHLSDNFGFEHTELPMGMGNVPLKEMMEKLGQKGFDAKKIIEAGAWWQHFRSAPLQESLEAMGSPIYGMKMAPYWSQASGLYQGYLSGLEGNWLPQTNYETFGTTFSRLPKELGGQAQSAGGSRMSGRPME